jgi:hypothetical protein
MQNPHWNWILDMFIPSLVEFMVWILLAIYLKLLVHVSYMLGSLRVHSIIKFWFMLTLWFVGVWSLLNHSFDAANFL